MSRGWQSQIRQGMSLVNWVNAARRGPRALVKRCGRVAVLRGASSLNARAFPGTRRRRRS